MNRSAQFELAFEGEPRPPIARRRPILAPAPLETRAELYARGPAVAKSRESAALPAAADWAGAREGVREVVLTLLATLAIGLGWAAIEAGRVERGAGPGRGPGQRDRVRSAANGAVSR